MANGERCRHCGRQETDHEYLEGGTCIKGFASEFRHRKGCPVIDCDGDCKSAIAKARRDLERRTEKIQH